MALNKRGTYMKISDTQKEVLQKYFREAVMTSTRKEVSPTIQKAAEETGVSDKRIKKWIINEKTRLRKKANEPAVVPAKKRRMSSFKRGPLAYNVYCSQIVCSDKCKGLQPDDKYKLAGQSWRELPEYQVSQYRSMAEEQKRSDVALANQDGETNAKLIKTHQQHLFH